MSTSIQTTTPKSRIKDIAGQRFGRLVARHPLPTVKTNGQVWLCECDCGETRYVSIGNLTSHCTTKCRTCAQANQLRNRRIFNAAFGKGR